MLGFYGIQNEAAIGTLGFLLRNNTCVEQLLGKNAVAKSAGTYVEPTPEVVVVEEAEDDNKSLIAIILIVIGVAIVVGVAVLVIVCCLSKKKSKT